MIRWREERRRWFNAIAIVLVALLAGGFVEVAARLVLVAAVANAAAGATFVAVLAVFVFRAAGRARRPEPYRPRDEDDEPIEF
jgi:heme A synthase